MLRLLVVLLVSLMALLAACDSDEEAVLPEPVSPTPNTIGDSIVFCGRIGVPGEATPSSPTPEPSCEPGDDVGSDFTSMGPGIRGRVLDSPPPLPLGLTALTRFMEIEADDSDVSGQIALPLIGESAVPSGATPVWYSYESGEWHALDAIPTLRYSVATDSALAEGYFDPLPANLILLAEG